MLLPKVYKVKFYLFLLLFIFIVGIVVSKAQSSWPPPLVLSSNPSGGCPPGTFAVNTSNNSLFFCGTVWTQAASSGSSVANALQFGTNASISLSSVNPSSGQVLEYNGSNIVGETISGGSSTWNNLLNATGNLILNNGANTTTFNQTNSTQWNWINTTSSTSTTNQNSPIITLQGTNWSGSVPASANDSWSIQDLTGSGANPVSQLSITHSGSSTASGLTSQILIPGGSLDDYYGGFRIVSSGNITLGASSGSSINFQVGALTIFEVGSFGMELINPGQHLETASANNDISGSIAISAATSASHTFATLYTSAPSCTLTPTSNPGSLTWWVTTSTTTVTANISVSGTITFNYICMGNPN